MNSKRHCRSGGNSASRPQGSSGGFQEPSGERDRLGEVLDSYLEAMKATQRPGSVRSLKSRVNIFIRYLKNQHPDCESFHDLDRPAIEGWFRYLAGRVPPLRNETRREYIISVRAFLDRIHAWGWIELTSPTLILKADLPPKDRRLPRPLPQEIDEALRAELKTNGDLFALALCLQRSTGMRLGELCDLELEALEEIAGNRWLIRVPLGKLHTERVIPVDEETAELFRKIRELRGTRPPVPHPETGKLTHFLLLWPGNGRNHCGVKLRRALVCAERGAKLNCHVTSHRLRHTFATELLRNGISLPALAKILGHRSIEMTLRYTQLVQEDVWRQYETARESIKSRYKIPASVPGSLGHQGDRADAHDLLKALIARLEGLRRDKEVRDRSMVKRVLERLRRIVRQAGPLQVLYGGKAHPADEGGKAMIRHIYEVDPLICVALRRSDEDHLLHYRMADHSSHSRVGAAQCHPLPGRLAHPHPPLARPGRG